ncbi:SIMPL domain-containing protein [Algoriphagus aestuariicola]|uniref:SIMPL domain-containing protein n=1 Tax=Algoriphagus aestuariicola TaxID=1852016 RepID=A0ABS3BQV5_9BACT|nr:SIMPL domain-containing protein [Algoriphagus aestuariicola]MBN7801641.1 SIMPL domain-containing protein [Algoriphagus aestuariicola]
MKRFLIFSLAMVMATSIFAQQVQQIPLIEVEGFAERKTAPDEAIFMISLEEKAMKVNDAVNVLNKKTQNLSDALKKGRIKDYKLVADNYAVDVNRIYRSGSQKDSGYVARQSLRIVTSATNEDLHKIADAIQGAGDMSYNLSFGISEATRKSLENTLLTEALKDAEARANLIGSTLNLKGLRVFNVTLEQNFRPVPMYNAKVAMAESADMLIETDEQSLTKRVFVKYTY